MATSHAVRATWKLLAGHRTAFIVSLGLAWLSGALAATGPALLLEALAPAAPERVPTIAGIELPFGLLTASIGILVVGVGSRWIFAIHDHRARSGWEVDLRERLFRSLLRDPARQARRSVGERIVLVHRLPATLVASAESVFRTPLQLLSMLAGVAFATGPGGWMALLVLLPPLVIVFVVLPRLLRLHELNEFAARELNAAASVDSTVLQEQVEGSDHLEGCGLERPAVERIRAASLAIKGAEFRGVTLGLVQFSLAGFALLLLPVMVLYADQLPAGIAMGGGAILVLFPQLQGAMDNLGGWTQSLRRLSVTIEAIENELQSESHSSAPTAPTTVAADLLTLHDVSITLPNGRLLLERVNCEFRRGEVHVICGPGGRGKSVLLDVIAGRFAGQVSGEFALDGASSPWSEWLGMSSRVYRVPQVPRLLRMTVKEYVEFGSEPGASSGRVGRGLELLRDVLGERSQGPEARRVLETDLIGGDRRLSGFQSQILRLAQVMGLPPRPVLCLDEPDSSMSAEDSALVQQVIADRLASESIVLVASHRPASYPIARARIWFIARDGILTGTHAELLERSQEYRDYNQTGAAD